MPSFDVAIIGLGVMGSAALAALARRGQRAVGFDRFTPGHDRGNRLYCATDFHVLREAFELPMNSRIGGPQNPTNIAVV